MNIYSLNISTTYVTLDENTATVQPAAVYYSEADDTLYYISDYLQADTRLLQTLFLGVTWLLSCGSALMHSTPCNVDAHGIDCHAWTDT